MQHSVQLDNETTQCLNEQFREDTNQGLVMVRKSYLREALREGIFKEVTFDLRPE